MAEQVRESSRVVRGLVYRYRAGDTVRVKGVGDWTLATDERNGLVVRLEAPEIVARVQDVTLLAPASNDLRMGTLIRTANKASTERVKEWALEDLGLATVVATKKVTLSLSTKTRDMGSRIELLELQASRASDRITLLLWASAVLLSAEICFWLVRGIG